MDKSEVSNVELIEKFGLNPKIDSNAVFGERTRQRIVDNIGVVIRGERK